VNLYGYPIDKKARLAAIMFSGYAISWWNQGAVWFTKYNVNGNGNGSHLITSGNKFE
jgi:hypothetical protein